mmetsp:Transcript_8057/g.11699  ORF Transcript_8057/g.11699 Transcript_8057/m.11699 type:complete len:517 (-) Transcript_8057:917-2467(-)|eukprot:CAMPEP_0194223666 /NCGR_PEP_ID=MMETSP0156-20130528/35666_1 /TAXON_ID=33649 /ORGANISM="Thalassionema nitzschioides, Strain L26-B" /LENGTH=516 /DNA_ID=CAMNT_0038954893 /DNA_START=81 /DNA_END=1631 /DNA_ORIENTATION=-
MREEADCKANNIVAEVVGEKERLEQIDSNANEQIVFESIQIWKSDTVALVQSQEMATFLASTGYVLKDVSLVAIHVFEKIIFVSCLPVTLPLHIITSGSKLIIGSCSQVTSSAVDIIYNTLNPGGENTASFSPVDGLIHHVSRAIPMALHTVDAIKNDFGGFLSGMLSPILGNAKPEEHLSAGESSSENDSYLDRLRLDFNSDVKVDKCKKSFRKRPYSKEGEKFRASPSDVSKFLLQVDDLSLYTNDGQHRLMYVDLSPDFLGEYLTSKALEAMFIKGLSLVMKGTDCPHIDLKPEGKTSQLLKKKINLSLDDWYTTMQTEVLVWSGRFKKKSFVDCDSLVFLSQGIVPGSPRDLFDLLWNSQRTCEYNQYCMGRSDALIIEDVNDPSTDRAIKVVKSETRVPFTNFSVVMSTVMYGCLRVKGCDGSESLAVVSRSLACGGSGFHTDHRMVDHDRKNEIKWNINLLRAVPGRPGYTDMVSISQVVSSLIPKFLVHRVGMAAVESCFHAIRTRDIN